MWATGRPFAIVVSWNGARPASGVGRVNNNNNNNKLLALAGRARRRGSRDSRPTTGAGSCLRRCSHTHSAAGRQIALEVRNLKCVSHFKLGMGSGLGRRAAAVQQRVGHAGRARAPSAEPRRNQIGPIVRATLGSSAGRHCPLGRWRRRGAQVNQRDAHTHIDALCAVAVRANARQAGAPPPPLYTLPLLLLARCGGSAGQASLCLCVCRPAAPCCLSACVCSRSGANLAVHFVCVSCNRTAAAHIRTTQRTGSTKERNCVCCL